MKAYTDIEQSTKLEEILPIKSADMFYWCGDQIRLGSYKAMDIEWDIPCWSLSALLNYLREIDFFPNIDADEHSVTMSINYYDEDEGKLLNPVHNIKVKAESFVDACYEMILKLHELKML